jgi:hypothetical protein
MDVENRQELIQEYPDGVLIDQISFTELGGRIPTQTRFQCLLWQ